MSNNVSCPVCDTSQSGLPYSCEVCGWYFEYSLSRTQEAEALYRARLLVCRSSAEQRTRLVQEVSGRVAEVQAADVQIAELQSALVASTRQVSEAQSTITTLRSELETVREARRNLGGELTLLRERFNSLSRDSSIAAEVATADMQRLREMLQEAHGARPVVPLQNSPAPPQTAGNVSPNDGEAVVRFRLVKSGPRQFGVHVEVEAIAPSSYQSAGVSNVSIYFLRFGTAQRETVQLLGSEKNRYATVNGIVARDVVWVEASNVKLYGSIQSAPSQNIDPPSVSLSVAQQLEPATIPQV